MTKQSEQREALNLSQVQGIGTFGLERALLEMKGDTSKIRFLERDTTGVSKLEFNERRVEIGFEQWSNGKIYKLHFAVIGEDTLAMLPRAAAIASYGLSWVRTSSVKDLTDSRDAVETAHTIPTYDMRSGLPRTSTTISEHPLVNEHEYMVRTLGGEVLYDRQMVFQNVVEGKLSLHAVAVATDGSGNLVANPQGATHWRISLVSRDPNGRADTNPLEEITRIVPIEIGEKRFLDAVRLMKPGRQLYEAGHALF